MPDAPRSFKTPLVPFVPIAGIITCLVMMLFLPADTWIRLVLWMLIGLDIYVCYGIKHSKLEHMLGTDHIGYDRYYPIRALRDYGALAPANRGMGRK